MTCHRFFLWELKQLWIQRIKDDVEKFCKGREHDGLAQKSRKTFTPRKLT